MGIGFAFLATFADHNFRCGGLAGTRTQDQRLKRPLLYRLSYQPTDAIEAPSWLPDCGIEPPRKHSGLPSKAWQKLSDASPLRKGFCGWRGFDSEDYELDGNRSSV